MYFVISDGPFPEDSGISHSVQSQSLDESFRKMSSSGVWESYIIKIAAKIFIIIIIVNNVCLGGRGVHVWENLRHFSVGDMHALWFYFWPHVLAWFTSFSNFPIIFLILWKIFVTEQHSNEHCWLWYDILLAFAESCMLEMAVLQEITH